MKKIVYLTALLTLLPFSASAASAIFGWNFLAAKSNRSEVDINKGFHKRLPLPMIDDITPEQNTYNIKLTAAQKHQALVWGIDTTAEKRYLLLMRNKSGVYFKNRHLTPVEILGINARNDQERRQYAQLSAKQEMQKIAKIFAFSQAQHTASVELQKQLNLPLLQPFDYSKYSPYNYKPINLQVNDKLFLFIKLGNSVRPVISSLMTSIKNNPTIHLNIYFTEQKNQKITQDQIFKWAQAQAIPPQMVNDKLITLNIADKKFKAINKKDKRNKKNKLPMLILVRGGKSMIVDIGRF